MATLSPRGSWLTREDFAKHRGETVTPIASNYRGLDVVELPPNGQGLVALVLLNILEHFDLSALDPDGPERLHLALEAARMAFAVRDTHVADPAFMRVSTASLIDKGFAGELARKIDRGRRVKLPSAPKPGSDTVYLTVVDRDRMAVSFINSLYSEFGSRIATEKTGIMLHSRGACFVTDPDHPNVIGPSKRPMNTIIPALGMRDGRCDLAFGVMGADYQPMGHAHVVSNLLDYGMDLQAAIDLPRVFYEGEETVVERGIPAETIAGLRARGHTVRVRERPWGGGQAIAIDWQRQIVQVVRTHGRADLNFQRVTKKMNGVMIMKEAGIPFEDLAGLGILDVCFKTQHVAFTGLGDFVEAHQNIDVLLFSDTLAFEHGAERSDDRFDLWHGTRNHERAQSRAPDDDQLNGLPKLAHVPMVLRREPAKDTHENYEDSNDAHAL